MLIERLKGNGEAVDEAYIARISKLSVRKPVGVGEGGKRPLKDGPVPRTWLVGLKPVQTKEGEEALAEKGQAEAEQRVSDEDSEVSWIRFRGTSRFRREAKQGDLVIQIWTENGKGEPRRRLPACSDIT